MRKFLSAVVVIPLALLFVIFAVANRHLVTVSFDPFNPADPAVSIRLPLFVIIIAVAILGVAAGGSASWFRHRRWRRAARRHEADARRTQRELADLRTSAAMLQRLPGLPQASGHGAAGRDKQGATDVVEPGPRRSPGAAAPTRSRSMPLTVKICGLSTPETLDAALQAGADMVGFVFFPPSPRHIGLEVARDLGRQAGDRAVKVALTVDADDATLAGIVEALRPDVLQLHGSESVARLRDIKRAFGLPVIKAMAVESAADLAPLPGYAGVADRILFDARAPRGATRPGGLGAAFDWHVLENLELAVPFMVSGGLTRDNVAAALRLTRAGGVDVSSGVERAPGVKDPAMIESFVRTVRAIGRDASLALAGDR